MFDQREGPFSRPSRPPETPVPKQRPWWASWITWLIILVILAFWVVPAFNGSLFGNSQSTATLSYSTFMKQVAGGNVESVVISDQTIVGKAKTPVASDDGMAHSTEFTTVVPAFGNDTVISELQKHGVAITAVPSSGSSTGFWFNLMFALLPIILIIGMYWWMTRRSGVSQNSNLFRFGQSNPRVYSGDGQTVTTFADVAGVDEAKMELQEVVDFLRSPGRYQRLGGRVPKGVLLVGQPGTGKTLLAKAAAGEANVPFLSLSASEFVEMLVGVGASRVRDLFDKAKKSAPCIIFVDELDAVGRERGAGLGGGNDEREQTLNQILVEMDGFDTRQAIIVLAATNRPDVLDAALLRPGRFDRQIAIDRPDRNGREQILCVHARRLPLGTDVDLDMIARSTAGMVGADLANLANEAALIAARHKLDRVVQSCFEEALDRIMMGAQRPLVLSDDERRMVAYHEGGHALVAFLTPGADPVHKVTIIPRGQSLGVTKMVPMDDRHSYPQSYLLARLAVGLAGRAAEELAIGQITTGAENDLQSVTGLAREMVTRWGMSSRIGSMFLGGEQEVFLGREVGLAQRAGYSEETAAMIDEDVRGIINERFAFVRKLLAEHREHLERVARALLDRETLDEADLRAVIAVREAATSAETPAEDDQPGALTKEVA
jgi:cell division protease FtsH